jgi:hypothetical protein
MPPYAQPRARTNQAKSRGAVDEVPEMLETCPTFSVLKSFPGKAGLKPREMAEMGPAQVRFLLELVCARGSTKPVPVGAEDFSLDHVRGRGAFTDGHVLILGKEILLGPARKEAHILCATKARSVPVILRDD